MPLMRTETFNQVRGQLASMSTQQLLTIERQAHSMRSIVAKDTNSIDDWLLDAILKDLDHRGLRGTVPPLSRLKQSPHLLPFQEQSQLLHQTYSQAITNLNRTQERRLALLIIQALVYHITYNWTTPGDTTFWGLIKNLRHAQNAMEVAYPGYLKAGLASLLVREE